MKKILKALSAFAVLTAMSTSCQKDNLAAQEGKEGDRPHSRISVTATIAGEDSRVAYSEIEADGHYNLRPSWEVGDIVIGFGNDKLTYGYRIAEVQEETGIAILEIITSGTYKGSAVEDPANGTTMYMMYAPGAKPSDIDLTKDTLAVSLKEQSANMVPALMMAQGTVVENKLSLKFTNQTAVIGIKNPTMASANTAYSSISIFGSGVCTDVVFRLEDGVLKATPQNPGRIRKTIALSSDGSKKLPGVVYIAAPALEQASKLTFLANNGEHFAKSGRTMEKGKYYYMTPTFTAIPSDAISGAFSIKDEGENVSIIFFSKGNLYASDNTGATWKFEANQYDYRTYASKRGCINGEFSTSKTPTNNWGTFCWSTTNSGSYGGRSTLTDTTKAAFTAPFKDWGELVDGSGKWFTLSEAQWKWLVGPLIDMTHNQECRQSSRVNGVDNARWMRCQLKQASGTSSSNYIHGVIMFPDVFEWPTVSGAPAESTATGINEHFLTYKEGPTYTYAEFKTLESAGAVFLPMEGYRYGTSIYSYTVGSSRGYYWTSTNAADYEKNSRASSFAHYESSGYGRVDLLRTTGGYVRLVTMAE